MSENLLDLIERHVINELTLEATQLNILFFRHLLPHYCCSRLLLLMPRQHYEKSEAARMLLTRRPSSRSAKRAREREFNLIPIDRVEIEKCIMLRSHGGAINHSTAQQSHNSDENEGGKHVHREFHPTNIADRLDESERSGKEQRL